MALEKLKQVFEDENLKDAPKAEHGTPKFAHLNVLVDYINALEAKVDAGLPSFANNTAATDAGLTNPQEYFNTTSGTVVVVPA